GRAGLREGRRDRAAAAAGRRGGVSARKPSKGLGRDAPIEERAPRIIRILSAASPDAKVALNFSNPPQMLSPPPPILPLLAEAYPDAKVALNFSNPLEMLVATILSAQCTDEKVNEVTETL